MRTHFLTYATASFFANARALADSALQVGFHESTVVRPEQLAGSAFSRQHASILAEQRGAGYWLWKPYVIREALDGIGSRDVLLYSDAGRTRYYSFSRFPARLFAELRRKSEGFLFGPAIGHLGTIREWTKRDCLVLMDADHADILDKPLLMTWSLWTRSPAALSFLDAWLRYCEDPRCLTDAPNRYGHNHHGFVAHRHDQSIASVLAHQTGAPYLDFSMTKVHRLILRRPHSELGHTFYKRPQNSDDLLRNDGPRLLAREYLRLKFKR
jgi:hypothetical protein